jgi:hypothetical protein
MGALMATKRRRRGRVVTQRPPKVDLKMQRLADSMLAQAQALFDSSADLDTCVRDTVYEGLARIIYAAYDTQACAQCVSDFDSVQYIQTKTYEWFRSHEFVEWFCVGASILFRNSRREFFRMKTSKNRAGHMVISREKVG